METPTNTPAYAAVTELLGRYYDGLYRGDTASLQTVFHPDAHYATAAGGTLLHLDLASYLPVVEARTPPERLGEAYGFEIESISFAGPATAAARMRCTMLSKHFTDLLTLVRLGGEWRILSKVFHYEPQQQAVPAAGGA